MSSRQLLTMSSNLSLAPSAIPLSPPRYQVGPPPSYTSSPGPRERRVLSSRRPQRGIVSSASNETHNVRSAAGTVELFHQPYKTLPVYARGGILDGIVHLDPNLHARVVQVAVQVQGRVRASILGAAAGPPVVFLDATFDLWSATAMESTVNSRSPAPFDLSFAIPLPPSFMDAASASERPLPATFEDNLATVDYRLLVHIVTRRVCLPARFTSSRRIIVPFVYAPRCRAPARGLGSLATLSGTLKAAPEEWAVVNVVLDPFSFAGVESTPWKRVHCDVALPASKTFIPGQRIPLHLQFTGDSRIIGALFAKSRLNMGDTASHIPRLFSIARQLTRPGRSSLSLSRSSSRTITSSGSRPSTPHSVASGFSGTTLVCHNADSDPLLDLRPTLTLEQRLVIREPSASITPVTEVRVLSSVPLAPCNLATSACPPYDSYVDCIALDISLTIPDDAPPRSFRVGPLLVYTALVLRFEPAKHAPYPTLERIIPIVLVDDAWPGDDVTEPSETERDLTLL
ncbi:hypothetical protein BKA62DRAFT_775301 [Auriculariales sp. MPI-PUGE-AT-0066]|nr:hypothetical protein BKA62DRAFT_775301 [Auriculariales sp. MPI-PUGE-AT-0066]